MIELQIVNKWVLMRYNAKFALGQTSLTCIRRLIHFLIYCMLWDGQRGLLATFCHGIYWKTRANWPSCCQVDVNDNLVDPCFIDVLLQQHFYSRLPRKRIPPRRLLLQLLLHQCYIIWHSRCHKLEFCIWKGAGASITKPHPPHIFLLMPPWLLTTAEYIKIILSMFTLKPNDMLDFT